MSEQSSSDGVRAARSIGVVYCIIGAAGVAYAVVVQQPSTTALTVFRWLLLASCFGFLVVGIVLLVLARLRTLSAVHGMPPWVRPVAMVGGVLLCLGLLSLAFSLALHPALWVDVAAVALVMVSFALLGLAAGVYRIHGGKRVS